MEKFLRKNSKSMVRGNTMEEQNRTTIIYNAQRKMLAADYEMSEIRSLLNELMALEELDEVIARANSYIAEAELRISRKNLSAPDSEITICGDETTGNKTTEEFDIEKNDIHTDTAEIVLNEQKRIIEKLLSKGIVPAQIHQWLDFPMELILETYKNWNK